jgi:hypothetical protein
MSDTSESLPQAPSGIGVSTIFRLLAIALGIMSAVLIARDGFNIPLNEYLDAVVALYDDTLTQIAYAVFDPAIRAVFEALRESFAIDLELLPHWKHAFVLLWLFLGSWSRALTASSIPHLDITLAGAFALLGGVAAGTVSPSGFAFFLMPVLSTTAFFIIVVALARRDFDADTTTRAPYRDLSRGFVSALGVVPVIVFTIAAVATSVGFYWASSPSPGLLSLLTFVVLLSVLTARLQALAILGGAAFLVWLSNALA